MISFRFETPAIQDLHHPVVRSKHCKVDVLRLDQLHPQISGNKWFKLTYYLEEAIRQQKKRVVTFGGPWSNHLLATAAACHHLQLESAALVRGERPAVLSTTLQDAESLGMKLHFLSRQDYDLKSIPRSFLTATDYLINEGGAGSLGVQGAATILDQIDSSRYTHMLCAAGTGTTLAGLINAAAPGCSIIGIPVLNDLRAIEGSLRDFVGHSKAEWQLLSGYAWGGYAKHPPDLLSFMNELYRQTGVPTDMVYTAKLFYACLSLLDNNFFEPGSRLLIVHSGGLQGNRSLPSSTFCFT